MRPWIFAVVCWTLPMSVAAQPNESYWGSFATSDISVRNEVSNCLQLALRRVTLDGPTIKLTADASFAHPLGQCGCTSGLLNYRVQQEQSSPGEFSRVSEWESGTVAAMPPVGNTKTFTFILSSDSEIRYKGKVFLEVSCKPAP